MSIYCEINQTVNQPANTFCISISTRETDQCSLWNKDVNVSLSGSVTTRSHPLGVKALNYYDSLYLENWNFIFTHLMWCFFPLQISINIIPHGASVKEQEHPLIKDTNVPLHVFQSWQRAVWICAELESIAALRDWEQERRQHWTLVNATHNASLQNETLAYERSPHTIDYRSGSCLVFLKHACGASEKCHLLQKDRKLLCILNVVYRVWLGASSTVMRSYWLSNVLCCM